MEIVVDVNLTPEQLSSMFVGWSDEDQAEFINLIGLSFKNSDFNAELQCSFLSNKINKDGKDFVFTLANFLKVQKISCSSKHVDALINSYPCDGLS